MFFVQTKIQQMALNRQYVASLSYAVLYLNTSPSLELTESLLGWHLFYKYLGWQSQQRDTDKIHVWGINKRKQPTIKYSTYWGHESTQSILRFFWFFFFNCTGHCATICFVFFFSAYFSFFRDWETKYSNCALTYSLYVRTQKRLTPSATFLPLILVSEFYNLCWW